MQSRNSIKVDLNQLLGEQERLEKEKSERLAQQESFEADFKAAQADCDKTEQMVRRMRLEQQDTDQPKILDYIKVCAWVIDFMYFSGMWLRCCCSVWVNLCMCVQVRVQKQQWHMVRIVIRI